MAKLRHLGKIPPKAKLQKSMHEVFTNEPSTVARANVSPKRKQKMKVAIAFAKARKGK